MMFYYSERQNIYKMYNTNGVLLENYGYQYCRQKRYLKWYNSQGGKRAFIERNLQRAIDMGKLKISRLSNINGPKEAVFRGTDCSNKFRFITGLLEKVICKGVRYNARFGIAFKGPWAASGPGAKDGCSEIGAVDYCIVRYNRTESLARTNPHRGLGTVLNGVGSVQIF